MTLYFGMMNLPAMQADRQPDRQIDRSTDRQIDRPDCWSAHEDNIHAIKTILSVHSHIPSPTGRPTASPLLICLEQLHVIN